MLTIVIPAKNEAEGISEVLSGIERAKVEVNTEVEVIVVDDGSVQKSDRSSMLNSLEVRSPFLTKRVISFAARLRARDKYNFSRGKIFLRKYLQSKRSISFGSKQGFGAPFGSWIFSDGVASLHDQLTCEEMRKWVNPDFVEKMLEEHVDGRQNNMYRISSLLSLSVWLTEVRMSHC